VIAFTKSDNGAMGIFSHVSEDEFRRWIEPLLERAGGYAFSIVRNREDAEDAIQEALLKAYLNMSRYERSRSFKGWWFAIIRNCCLDLLRKRVGRHVTVAIDPSELPSPGNDARGGVERGDELIWALNQLTPVHREIIELRYFGDCSYSEIAEALGIPEGTVMSRLHAARHALAAIYRKEKR
jgi:RNA polymerase sigma-70 factor (ECF subfamily)